MNARPILIWTALGLFGVAPVVVAAASPLLEYRDAPYIASGLAGALAMSILLIQPLLGAGYLPGLSLAESRRIHRTLGFTLTLLVLIHIGGLYLTSPPDTLDALLLVSPTPFSIYGVTALWTLLATALFVALRRKLYLRPTTWAAIHNALAVVVVIASVVHALMIEGTMGTVTKWAICLAALIATAAAVIQRRLLPKR